MINEFLSNLKNKKFDYIKSKHIDIPEKKDNEFSKLSKVSNKSLSKEINKSNQPSEINKTYCNYANGNLLSCYLDNVKSSIKLYDIIDNEILNKKLSNFLFNNVVKKWIFIEPINESYLVYLDSNKISCLNDLIKKEKFYIDYIDSLSPKIESSTVENTISDKKIKNYAYGLFVNKDLTIECLYKNQKINLTLPELQDINTDYNYKKIKDILFEFVSKKSIVLDFIDTIGDNYFLVNIFNKNEENLNALISLELKNKLIKKTSTDNEINNSNDVVTEDYINNDEAIVEEQSLGNLANIVVKKDSPFSKRKSTIQENNDEAIVEEQSLGNLANIVVKKDSPFSKRKSI